MAKRHCGNCRASSMDWCNPVRREACQKADLKYWLPDDGICICGEPGHERVFKGLSAGVLCDDCWEEAMSQATRK